MDESKRVCTSEAPFLSTSDLITWLAGADLFSAIEL